ncbi:hypothetical protein MMC30_002904 [Trapelia coarctata]|nr:hypothetical protein [Trapelia coarctata]
MSSGQFKDVVSTIAEAEYVASYNWLDKKTPTILVPGAPPAWTPPTNVPNLEQDSGRYFRDPNAARWPQFPMEPAVRAVFSLHADFKTTKIDVVGCASTMGNLLKFAEEKDRSFVFRVEVIGNTVFLIRQGASPDEVISGVHGYGHTFPEAYTTWGTGLQGSASHQRLIKYRLGEINCLLRSEIDGYIENAFSEAGPSNPQAKLSKLSKDMSSLSLKAESKPVSEEASNRATSLVIESAGRQILQSAIFDLKTRSRYNGFNMADIYSKLWLSQIPNFAIAYHSSGKFVTPRPREVQGELKMWGKNNQRTLRQFHTTLHKLIAIAKQSKDHKLEVRRSGSGQLVITQVSGSWSALPHDLIAKWAGALSTPELS